MGALWISNSSVPAGGEMWRGTEGETPFQTSLPISPLVKLHVPSFPSPSSVALWGSVVRVAQAAG